MTADAEAIARSLLAASPGDAGADAWASAAGAVTVQRKRGRRVFRVPLAGAAVFAKAFDRSRAAEGRAEADALRRLAVTGVPVAPLLAEVAAPDGRRVLVLADAGPGLDEVLALEGHLAVKARERLRRAARTVRALHVAGFRFPDLLARHLRVGGDGEVRLIDVARLAGPGASSPARRAADLGAFFGTLPRLAVPERARLRFFREATADLDRERRRALAAPAARAAARTRGKSRHRRALVEIAPAARDALLAAEPRAERFDLWFGGEPGVRLRRLRDRENRRLDAGGRTWFLKRHFDGSRAAVVELEGALAFRRAGVPAALPAAWGEDVARGSFWLAEAAPGEPLDDLLRRPGAVPPDARRELARLLGAHAARLRAAGLFHRDFYLNHWIGRWTRERGWELALIDLQRWGRAGLLRERWHVKDAAALWHSARGTAIRRTDAVRFLRRWLRIPRLDGGARRVVARVLRRAAAMAARTPRTRTGGEDPS